MKIRETSPASSTGRASCASASATAPFWSLRPVAVIMPETISSQGVLDANRLAIQSSRWSNPIRCAASLVAWNAITSRQYLAQLRAYSGLASRASISWARLSLARSRTKSWTCSGVGGPAGQVEVNPAYELDIAGERRRLDLGVVGR